MFREWLKRMAILLIVLGGSITLFGQTASTSANPNNPAIAIVQQAITAMGGNAWAAVGAATAQSTTLYPNKSSFTTTRNNDWSKNVSRMRADIGGTTSTVTTIETANVRALLRNSKAVMSAPASYDLASIAEMYPAVALRIAIQRNCQFQTPAAPPIPNAAENGSIAMVCLDPSYPGYHAHFLWWFDASGLPTQVRVPLLSSDSRYEFHEVFRFSGYQQIQGLSVPMQVQVFDTGRLAAIETITSVTFQASLPDATFSISSQQ